PPSAPIDSELCSLDPIVPPSAAPPTRMMCGIARKNRKNVVRRSRFVSAGCTVTVTGYAIATSPNHQITLSVNDEFEEVAVWIAVVGARPAGLAPAWARHGPSLHPRPGRVEPGLELRRRAVPDEAEIAARRLRGGRAQREARVLPALRPMEIDHVAAGVDRDG